MKTKESVSRTRVSDVMTHRVEMLSPIDTVKQAVKVMLDSKLTALPVVDAECKCVGIISRSDLTEMFLSEDNELSHALDTDRLSMEWLNRSLETSESRQVKELMTYDVLTVRAEQTLADACQEMVRGRIHHLPVVDDEGAVVGILSTFDIVTTVAKS